MIAMLRSGSGDSAGSLPHRGVGVGGKAKTAASNALQITTRTTDPNGEVPTTSQALQPSTLRIRAKATAREVIIFCFTAFLFASALLSFLAFLSLINSTENTKRFLTALDVVINAVAVVHYRWVGKLRSYGRSTGWLSQKSAVELAVDSIRLSDWLITMVFLTVKLYALIGRPFEDYDSYFKSVEVTALTTAGMVLCGAVARIGTDEVWKQTFALVVIGIVFCMGSMACLVLLLTDLHMACNDIKEAYLLRSFFYLWVGYPTVMFASILARLCRNAETANNDKGVGEYPERLSLIKDVAYGLLDVWAKGVFALCVAAPNGPLPIPAWNNTHTLTEHH